MDMTGRSALSISDFYVNQPLQVKPDSAQPVQLLLRKQGEGYRFSAQTYSEAFASVARVRIRCDNRRCQTVVSSPHYDIDELRKRCSFGKLGLDHPARNRGAGTLHRVWAAMAEP